MDTAVLADMSGDNMDSEGKSRSPKRTINNKCSKHHYIQNYFTEKEWKTLKNPSLDRTTKLRVVGKRCVSIGLKHICDKTARRIAAILELAEHEGPPCDLNIQPFDFLGTCADAKVMVQQAWNGIPKQDLRLDSYPSQPERLGVPCLDFSLFFFLSQLDYSKIIVGSLIRQNHLKMLFCIICLFCFLD